jgi:hypothetical protein
MGDDLRKSDGKWMNKRRMIDREADECDEVVTDPETRAVNHECRELLSKHTEHRSAKTRVPNPDPRTPNEEAHR